MVFWTKGFVRPDEDCGCCRGWTQHWYPVWGANTLTQTLELPSLPYSSSSSLSQSISNTGSLVFLTIIIWQCFDRPDNFCMLWKDHNTFFVAFFFVQQIILLLSPSLSIWSDICRPKLILECCCCFCYLHNCHYDLVMFITDHLGMAGQPCYVPQPQAWHISQRSHWRGHPTTVAAFGFDTFFFLFSHRKGTSLAQFHEKSCFSSLHPE